MFVCVCVCVGGCEWWEDKCITVINKHITLYTHHTQTHIYLVTWKCLFLPHVLQEVKCLRENTHLVPVCGDVGREQHIPMGEEGRGRREGGEGRERERRERRKWGEKGKEDERAEGKKGGRKRDREDKVLNYGWKSLLVKQEGMLLLIVV